jgi:hypothetical protein
VKQVQHAMSLHTVLGHSKHNFSISGSVQDIT